MVVKTNGIPFWLVGEFTTHLRTDFSGDWDVHSGHDLGFDPWPYLCAFVVAGESASLRGKTKVLELSTWRPRLIDHRDLPKRCCPRKA